MHSPLFSHPWNLRNPKVKAFTSYSNRKKSKFIPNDYGLSNTEFRHLKVLDFLDENGFESLTVLKDGLELKKRNFFTYHRLEKPLEAFRDRKPGLDLNSRGVKAPSDKQGM